MHNKHQELIIEKVLEFRGRTRVPRNEGQAVNFARLDDWLTQTLQDTIDKVLEEEKMQSLLAVKEALVAVGKENIEDWIDQTIEYRTLREALDKTPPNKV